jgi:hypothetical protein
LVCSSHGKIRFFRIYWSVCNMRDRQRFCKMYLWLMWILQLMHKIMTVVKNMYAFCNIWSCVKKNGDHSTSVNVDFFQSCFQIELDQNNNQACTSLTCQSCHPKYQQIFDCIYFCHKCNILVGVWNFYISCSDQ